MPRYAFRIPVKGRRSRENANMVITYKPGASHIAIYSCGSEAKAKKLAIKQNEAAWFLGIFDENDRLIKPIKNKKAGDDNDKPISKSA